MTDLTNRAQSWERLSELVPIEFGWKCVHKGKIYGIWAWTDIRGIWYWKDLLNKTGVDPNSLTTWDGYIASAKKINAAS